MWLLLLLLLLPAAAVEDFCVPAAPQSVLQHTTPPALAGGPAAVQAALRPYLRRCLYLHLPAPQDSSLLELCLLKSARVIDRENFSLFLGYFTRWEEGSAGAASGAGASAAGHEYSGGASWSCKDGVQRSVALRLACSGATDTDGSRPAITLWRETGECHYEAHLLLPGTC
jgi:hypothetical protein